MTRRTGTRRIGARLAAALVVPLAALVVVAGVSAAHGAGRTRRVRARTAMAITTIGPAGLVAGLQHERERAVADLLGLGRATHVGASDTGEARAATDDALGRFRAGLRSQGPGTRTAYAPVLPALDQLAQLRADIDVYGGPRTLASQSVAADVFTRYTDVVRPLLDAATRTVTAIDDDTARQGALLLDVAGRQADLRARLANRLMLAGLSNGFDSRPEIIDVGGLVGQQRRGDEQLRAVGTGRYARAVDRLFAESDTKAFVPLVERAMAGDPFDLTAALDLASSRPGRGYDGLRDRAGPVVRARVDDIVAGGRNRERLHLALAALAVLLAAAAAWRASRSITARLGAIRRQTDELAVRLPQAVRRIHDTPLGDDVSIPELPPVEAGAADEVGAVATALQTFQSKTLDAAVEQALLLRAVADSFLSLGRRNSELVSRQLDTITELERKATDPATLDDLFRLDHLATRMRRNTEALLALGGVEPSRQWSAPVRVDEVVRAALGEIERYDRVEVKGLPRATMAGSATADVAHLLAELIDDALASSPSDQPVEVRGRVADDGYRIAVVDYGTGVDDDALATANRRLARAESFTVAPSSYLGHYVAGALAARHGIRLKLHQSPAGGATAEVVLPPALLVDDSTPALGPAPAPALETPALETPALETPALAAPAPHAVTHTIDLRDNGPASLMPPAAPANGHGADGADGHGADGAPTVDDVLRFLAGLRAAIEQGRAEAQPTGLPHPVADR